MLSLDADVSLQNAWDIRPAIGLARRDGVLELEDLLALKQTDCLPQGIAAILENLETEVPHSIMTCLLVWVWWT